jgi:hypothetical protein
VDEPTDQDLIHKAVMAGSVGPRNGRRLFAGGFAQAVA